MNDSEKQKRIKKAKKLLELAKRGHEGEMDSAKRKLEEHLKKYGLDISEIDEEQIVRVFTVRSNDEYDLLTNIILSVNPFCKIEREQNSVVKGDLDAEDYAEVKNKFKYFWNLWLIESDLRTLCFYTKHQQFLRPDQYAYDKHSNNGKKESQEIVKQKEEQIKMSSPTEQPTSQETPKEKMHRFNQKRMQNILPNMIDANYVRGKNS